ncbi:MAG: PKD domain-containing protein [Verrucomicrobiota bacterium]|nr:PKD domain-containing protein [Verrucomicrobiota bacterium]
MKIKFLVICLATLLGSLSSSHAQQTKRIFLVGNSVTDGINYEGFKNIALEQGNTHIYARNMIPGAPLAYLWDATDGFSTSPYGWHGNALPNYEWDCISLQPFDRGLTGADGDVTMFTNYINEAKGKSPNVQFYVYSRYPRKPNGVAVYTATIWNQCWLGTYTGAYQSNETRKYFEDLCLAVRAANPSVKPALIIPAGEVMYELNKKLAAGQVPGFTSIWDVYADGIHVNSIGSYLLASTFYATIYKGDPRGTPVPQDFGSIPADMLAAIQQTVYEVVFTNAYSGASAADLIPVDSVTIAQSTLELTILQSGSLDVSVLPTNAANKQILWTSSDTGVATVSQKGVVLAVGNGTALITATSKGSGVTDTCTVNVTGTIPGTTTTGIVAGWNFAGLVNVRTANATQHLAGISTTAPSLVGTMSTIFGNNSGIGGFLATGQTSTTLKAAISSNAYFSFMVTPEQGKLVNINKIHYYGYSQNQSRTFSVLSSVKGFNENAVLDTYVVGPATRDIVLTGHSNLADPIEIRVYFYGPTNGYEAVGFAHAADGKDFTVEGSVLSPSDNEQPSAPMNLLPSFVKDTQFHVTWSPATDNLVVWGYNLYLNGQKLNTTLLKDTQYDVTGLTLGTSYNVEVEAVDFVGNTSSKSAVVVMTNRQPTARISTTPDIDILPGTAVFSADTSSDPDAGDYILGFDWDFGDGSVHQITNNITYTYAAPGTYTVTLRVMDNRNLWSTVASKSITINEAVIPAVETVDTVAGKLTLTYQRLRSASAVKYVVGVSDDLVTWDWSEAEVEVVGTPVPSIDLLTEAVTIRVTTPLSTEMPKKFLTVKVTRP